MVPTQRFQLWSWLLKILTKALSYLTSHVPNSAVPMRLIEKVVGRAWRRTSLAERTTNYVIETRYKVLSLTLYFFWRERK